MDERGDLELARACARGEEGSWEEFERRYFGVIRAFAARALPGAAGADLAGEVIADLWQRGKIGRFEGRSSLKTWLAAVVGHAAANASKRERRWTPLEEREPPVAPRREAESETGRTRLGALLAEAAARLPPVDRLLVLLYYDRGLTLEEAGLILRRSKAVLSRRLTRVTGQLRNELEARSRERFGISARDLAGPLEAPEIDLASLFGPQQSGSRAVFEKGDRA